MEESISTLTAGARIYYFDKRTVNSDNPYLGITEVNLCNQHRSTIYIYPEYLSEFSEALEGAINTIKNGKTN